MAKREEKDGKLSGESSRGGITLENYKPLKVPAKYGTEWEQLMNPPTFADLVRKVRVGGIMSKYKPKPQELPQQVSQEELAKAAADLRSFRSDKSLLTEEGTGKRENTRYDRAYDRAEKEFDNVTERRRLANELQNTYRRGALTSKLLGKARKRADELGIEPDKFDSFMKKHNIKAMKEDTYFGSPDAPTSSREEAAQNVLFQSRHGGEMSGLKSLKAMQDPNYEIGTGGALSPAGRAGRPIGTESGAMMRAARKLKDAGYKGAAEKIATAGAVKGLSEPSISTPASKAQAAAQDITTGRLAQQQAEEASSYTGGNRAAAEDRAAKRRAADEKRASDRAAAESKRTSDRNKRRPLGQK